MSDPPRLLGSPDATDLEQKLLASWGDERPPAAARDKTLAMLGLATGTAAAGAATAGASIAPKAAAAGWLAIAKWIGVAGIAISAASIGIGVALHRGDRIEAPVAATATTQPVAPPVVTATVTAPPTTTIELPAETAHHAAPQRVTTAPPASSTLADQIAALDRARVALDARDGARARKLVDAYEASYPGGAFTQEAELVRIEALLRDENRAEAERAGKRFLAAYPKSPHAARVRTLLGYDP